MSLPEINYQRPWRAIERNGLVWFLYSYWNLMVVLSSAVLCHLNDVEEFFLYLNFRHYWPLTCSLHMKQTLIKQSGVLIPFQNLPFGTLQLIQCCICSRHRGIPNVQYFNHDRCGYNMSACSGDVLVRIKTWQFLMSFDWVRKSQFRFPV